MSTWRRKAIEAFPDLRWLLQDNEETIYTLFSELLHKLPIDQLDQLLRKYDAVQGTNFASAREKE
jgi:hypothetical protein